MQYMKDLGVANKRKIHIEILRIVSIYCVMFNHTQDNGFFYFSKDIDNPISFFYMFSSVLCKVAVPIFFMITGAVLLNKEENLKELFIKRILKYVLILLGVSLIYYFGLRSQSTLTIGNFIETIYSSEVTTGMWYLYSYLGILIMLPILRKVVKVLSVKEYEYMFICHLILVGLLPMLEYLIWNREQVLNPSFSAVIFTTNNIFYVLLGYYIENVFEKKAMTKGKTVIVGLGGILAIVISCAMTYYRASIMGICNQSVSQVFFSSLISVPCVAVYCITYKICEKGFRGKIERVIVNTGGAVFGAYLLEKIIRLVTAPIYNICNQIFNPYWSSVGWVVIGMTLGLIFVIIIKKIPIIGKYVQKVI